MPISEDIGGLLNRATTNETFKVLKDRYAKLGLDGITIGQMADAYTESIQELRKAIDINILDSVPFYKLNSIRSNLEAIHANALVITNYTYPNPQQLTTSGSKTSSVGQQKAAYQGLATNTMQLQSFVYDCRLTEKMTSNQEVDEQINELKKLINEYSRVLETLNNIRQIEEQATDAAKDIRDIWTTVMSEGKTLNDQLTSITDNNARIKSILSETENLKLNVKANNQEIENNKVQILAFASSIPNYDKQMQKVVEDSNSYLKDSSKAFSDVQLDLSNKTNDIIKVNQEYHEIIKVLLKGANAGSLNQTFEQKANLIEKTQWLWLSGVLVCITLILGLSLYEFDHMAKFTIWEKLAERGVLIVPLILLDIFLVFQYNKRQKLIEEYRFKSAMALSLWAFHDLVEKNKEGDVSKAFVIDSIKRIFESPFQDSSNLDKGQRDLLLKVLQSIGGKIDKAGDDLIKKTLG